MTLFSRFLISGHSMQPVINEGQVVFVSGVPYIFNTPNVGDIIAFKEKKSGLIFIKRIVKKEGVKYLVAGDNNKDTVKTGWISKEEILGKVISY